MSANSPEPPSENGRSAFSVGLFRTLWIANLGSGIGATMHDTAAVWTLALATDKAWVVTLYQTLLSFPLFLFALPSGAMADLLDKRRFVLGVQIAGALVAGLMALAGFLGFLPPTLLLTGAFLLGTSLAFTLPAWQAMIPEIVDKPRLPSAITLGGVGINISRAIGPFVGGYLVAIVGAAPVFALNAASYLGLIIVLARWKRPAPAPRPHAETVTSAMIAAIRHVRYTKPIQHVYLRHALFAFSVFAPVALLPLIVRELKLPAEAFGLLMGLYGGGGIVTAFLLLPLVRKHASLDTITVAAGLVALACLISMPWLRDTLSLGACMLVVGGAWLVVMSQLHVAGQTVFPHWVRARASALHMLAIQGAIAVGALLWGALTDRFGLPVALWSAAGGVGLYLIASLRFRLNDALEVDLQPVEADHTHDSLVVEPEPTDGPVRVSIHYEIDANDERPFLAAIGALRESRLRDGAYRWNLWRDLAHPTLLTEVFLVGSWEEHLRQGDRATANARSIEDRVIAFHRGNEAPRVDHALHLIPRPEPNPSSS